MLPTGWKIFQWLRPSFWATRITSAVRMVDKRCATIKLCASFHQMPERLLESSTRYAYRWSSAPSSRISILGCPIITRAMQQLLFASVESPTLIRNHRIISLWQTAFTNPWIWQSFAMRIISSSLIVDFTIFSRTVRLKPCFKALFRIHFVGFDVRGIFIEKAHDG